MKKYLFLVLTIATLFACGSDTKPVEQSAAPTINFKTNSVPVPFSGNWISDTYLRDILDHQSPRKAQETIEECYIQIPENTLRPTTMVINFHEGISDLVTVHNNGVFQLWEKQGDTLSNVKYTIQPLTPDSIKIDDKLFIKINSSPVGNEPRILEEILFKGTYNSKKGEKIEFKSNGEVTGLGQYKVYKPLTDYFDAGLQVDQVGLGETIDKLEYFGFKFKKNKLELYKLKCDEYDDIDKRCVEVSFGDKLYDLQKSSPE
jgi:hypothetical protein